MQVNVKSCWDWSLLVGHQQLHASWNEISMHCFSKTLIGSIMGLQDVARKKTSEGCYSITRLQHINYRTLIELILYDQKKATSLGAFNSLGAFFFQPYFISSKALSKQEKCCIYTVMPWKSAYDFGDSHHSHH